MGCVHPHHFVNVCPYGQHLIAAVPAAIQCDADERGIGDGDPAALGRRYQPEGTGGVAAQHRTEQTDKCSAINWRTTIEPATIAIDVDVEMAAVAGQTAIGRRILNLIGRYRGGKSVQRRARIRRGRTSG